MNESMKKKHAYFKPTTTFSRWIRTIGSKHKNKLRLFCSLISRILTRLNSKFKCTLNKKQSYKASLIYKQFQAFFKNVNEFEILRYLQKIDPNQINENQLFFILMSTLIRYMKTKTDSIILKLSEKSKKEDIRCYQESSITILDYEKKINLRPQPMEKRRVMNTVKNRERGSILGEKRFNSLEYQRPMIQTERKYSRPKKTPQMIPFESQCKTLTVRQPKTINWRVGLKKFKQVYALEWELYFQLLKPLNEELQEIKGRPSKTEALSKKEWISDHFSGIFRECLSRNMPFVRKVSQPQDPAFTSGQQINRNCQYTVR